MSAVILCIKKLSKLRNYFVVYLLPIKEYIYIYVVVFIFFARFNNHYKLLRVIGDINIC